MPSLINKQFNQGDPNLLEHLFCWETVDKYSAIFAFHNALALPVIPNINAIWHKAIQTTILAVSVLCHHKKKICCVLVAEDGSSEDFFYYLLPKRMNQ